jgi:DNA-binding transcriptional MocR family regulator
VKDHGAALLSRILSENGYDSEYRYEGRPIEAVQGLDPAGRVIYMGTFSKVLFPALRLGYLVLPPPLVETVHAAKWLTDTLPRSLCRAGLILGYASLTEREIREGIGRLAAVVRSAWKRSLQRKGNAT